MITFDSKPHLFTYKSSSKFSGIEIKGFNKKAKDDSIELYNRELNAAKNDFRLFFLLFMLYVSPDRNMEITNLFTSKVFI